MQGHVVQLDVFRLPVPVPAVAFLPGSDCLANLGVDTANVFVVVRDVMSMLLFGKPTAAMSETEGESGAGLLSAAMASAGGKAARATGAAFLQNVQIDPGSGSVEVGFPLTDKVYLSIQKVTPDSDTDNITQASVEWILSRSTYGEVVTGDRGKSSGDLYWRWRF